MKEPKPITRGGEDRGYKLCRCCVCGTTQVCTPYFDFYTKDDPEGPLYCEPCLLGGMSVVFVANGNPEN